MKPICNRSTIKLTETLYVNPDGVILVEFTPGNVNSEAFLTVIFENSDLSHLYVRGTEAEHAFANWKVAHEAPESNDKHGNRFE